jgi:hypothetical protein
VQIKVSKDSQIFNVHKALICRCSPYFDAAFKWAYQASSTAIISFPETSVRVFKLLLAWFYTQMIWIAGRDQPIPTPEDLIDLYIFADQVQMPFLQNDTIAAIISVLQMQACVPTNKFRHIWENTSEHCPLRQLMVDICVWCAGPDIFNIGSFPTEKICVDVMRGFWLRSRHPMATSPLLNCNNYHVSTIVQTKSPLSKGPVCTCKNSK